MEHYSMSDHVLCFVPTKDRYFTTLPLVISSIINQTVRPNELVIYDDTEKPTDLRNNVLYTQLFKTLSEVGIEWKVLFGRKRGQHFGHQMSQNMAKKYVWRVDDDEIPESNVLQKLLSNMVDNVGAVAGLVLPIDSSAKTCKNNPISDLSDNCQWYRWSGTKEVQHLYSSFLYRKDIAEYELALSPACHREETIFTHRIYRKGYRLIVDASAITRHFRNPEGGIRPYPGEMFQKDEKIFNEILREWEGDMVCYLDNGKGDHIVFKSILPQLKAKYKRVRIACVYADVFKDEETMSIDEGKKYVTPDRFNVYKYMIDHDWKTEMEGAFKRMYLNL